jgi:N-acetylmuramoyl-L-alanine amidase
MHTTFYGSDCDRMSANPSQLDWEAPTSVSSPLQEGNRVLESIARQEALRALLAFSDLHEQIRDRRIATGCESDRDLFETERFIRDEVLQLICDRALAITQSDSIVIALGERSERDAEISEMVCRASAGPLAVARGVRLIGESEFLQDCLDSGRILRCDDCEIDARVELDFSRAIGARSTVLVPLRGRREQLGVLQAFSRTPWAFTDHDIRCFDLFAELVLSALKPEDQDRRIYWLSDVAGEILQIKPAVIAEVVETPASEAPKTELGLEAELAPSTAATLPDAPVPSPVSERFSEISDPLAKLPEPNVAEAVVKAGELFEIDETPASAQIPRVLPFPNRFRPAINSRLGLSIALGLVAVAALFSAGAWWGMQVHDKAVATKVAATKTETSPRSVTTPSLPAGAITTPAASDNLMSPEKLESDSAPLTAVAADKLASLPKITGVRHWSSSMRSTVVIDMEDNVPYEVHRLMSPERIYFDLHDTALAPELDGKTMDVGDASLSRVRIAQPVAGVTRVVLDTKDGSNFSVSMESSPYRLVVELRGSEKNLTGNRSVPGRAAPDKMAAPVITAAAKAAPLALPATKATDQPLPASTGKFRIVLDAGHGGWDLGTVGRQGLLEKDLVLDVTQRLGKLLQTRLKSEVMFTRTGDSYLPLDQRADIANQAQADLFVSIHANYSSSASARGVETYYTNLFSSPGSREVEKHEDGTFSKLTPVSLSAGALHEKIAGSQRLAASVQRALYATLAANSPDIRNRGIKDSAFVVLIGATMPAILTEISFVSSPADERNLQSATYRQQIAEALYQGIAHYQQSSPHTKVAQLQTTARR